MPVHFASSKPETSVPARVICCKTDGADAVSNLSFIIACQRLIHHADISEIFM
ncbi:hypothetical protein CES86_2988 [Brucella lupini]|uniref:Uncharacterized protein n=1 Tax=Brucella lupini TaxID=255457 RepID=A0A256GMH4_9HYPH|nr:hypothetical protein CES86_2988 [Brucella lupini]